MKLFNCAKPSLQPGLVVGAMCLVINAWVSPVQAQGKAPAAPATAASGQSKLDCGMNTGQRATGEPILLGGLVSKTGPDDFSASGVSATAYFRCVNDNGGINGRPINYILADDKWDPKEAREAAERLLFERKVVALVGGSSFPECDANEDLYKRLNLTVLLGTGVERKCFFSPHIAAVNTGPRISGLIAVQHAVKRVNAKSVVCVAIPFYDQSDWDCAGLRDWGAKAGVTVRTVVFDPEKFNPVDVMARATAAPRPQVVMFSVPRGILIPLLQEAQKRDLARDTLFASTAAAYNPEVAAAMGPYWKDRLVVNLEFAPVDSTGPDNLNWRAVMNKYAARTDTRDAFSQGGYLAARAVTQAMLTLKPDQINRQTVNEAIRRVRNVKSDMLCRPFYVAPAGQRNNANYSGPVAVFNGSGWTKDPAGCITVVDGELSDVLASERRLGLLK
jgi:branched-chain amino acid transport system substrate-binding protein